MIRKKKSKPKITKKTPNSKRLDNRKIRNVTLRKAQKIITLEDGYYKGRRTLKWRGITLLFQMYSKKLMSGKRGLIRWSDKYGKGVIAFVLHKYVTQSTRGFLFSFSQWKYCYTQYTIETKNISTKHS